jgi:homocitrate synthase NifV
LAALQPNCRLTAWCRALEKDIDLAAGCGTEGVHISFPVSSILLQAMDKNQRWVLDQLEILVRRALDRFRLVSVGAQDAFRVDPAFLHRFVRLAADCGAHRIRIADTVGLARSSQVFEMVGTLLPLCGQTGLEFHGHNDLGMATANTIAAIEAGAGAVSVTVNGLGERAGNAPLEQVVMAAHTLDNRYCAVDPEHLMPLCRFVARITDRPIAVDRPICGENVFSHESGIHCAALLKDPATYQPFDPAILGRQSARMVLGRHSGSRVVQHLLEKAGVKLDQAQARSFLNRIRSGSRLPTADLARNCTHTLF